MIRTNLHPQVQMWTLEKKMNGESLHGDISEVLLAPMPRVLVLDLRRIEMTDSNGLAWLVNLNIRMRETGGSLILLNPSSQVMTMLEEARVDGYFLMVPDTVGIRDLLIDERMDLGLVRIAAEN